MTIAMCYLAPEGVVLGADSTSSTVITSGLGAGGFHYLNHNQKLFELGEQSTVGIITWGLGGLSSTSHRTLIALFADKVRAKPATSLKEVAVGWANDFWSAYNVDGFVSIFKTLDAKPPHDPNNSNSRTPEEESQHGNLKNNLVVGFCLAGYWPPDRQVGAFEIVFSPTMKSAPSPRALPMSGGGFWGMPNMIKRLIYGVDENVIATILQSGKWSGTQAELECLLNQFQLGHPPLPIRDAIDFVHSCIHSTIKAMKFSNLSQVCGGPIEIGVITSDRLFRWVRHKPWDAAIMEGAI